MLIGDRLKQLREEKKLSQGDIEKRTGLLRCYISRVENGHTVPSVETLQKCARALEVPMYRLFYAGDQPPKKPKLPLAEEESTWGSTEKENRELRAFRNLLARMDSRQRELLLMTAHRMGARRAKGRGGAAVQR